MYREEKNTNHIKSILLAVILTAMVSINCRSTDISNDFSAIKVSKNVYSIVSPNIGLPTPENKGWNSNVHFVVTEKGVLLFDTGSSQLIGENIKKAIQSVTELPVRWIVNSHSHADHWLGNAAFINTAEEIIATELALANMKKYGKDDLEFYSKITEGTMGPTKLFYPNSILTHSLKRNFGGVDITFIFSKNAHSPGDILMWLPQQKIIFGGDVLSSSRMPIITDHSDMEAWIENLNYIEELNPTIVLTGHGHATTKVSVMRDSEFFLSILKQIKTGCENRTSLDEIQFSIRSQMGPVYQGLYENFDADIDQYVEQLYRLQNKQ